MELHLSQLAERVRRAELADFFESSSLAPISLAPSIQPLMIQALALSKAKSTILIGVPTSADAERLTLGLRAFAATRKVLHFPAFETLPFERVSPSIEIMGRRQEVIWSITQDDSPLIVVASARAMTQQLIPPDSTTSPINLNIGTNSQFSDPRDLVEALVSLGYRREYQVEHRGEVAIRGGIVDVFPCLGSWPVRIDFYGDEIDRITNFSANDQRSIHNLLNLRIYSARELIPTERIKKRAEQLIDTQTWGAKRWEMISEGILFDGMESWLPWLVETPTLISDLIGNDSHVVLIDSDRMRARANDLVEEESQLASALAPTWGLDDLGPQFPSLHVPFDEMLTNQHNPLTLVSSIARPGETSLIEVRAWNYVAMGDAQEVANKLQELLSQGYQVIICCAGEGSLLRIYEQLRDCGLSLELIESSSEQGALDQLLSLTSPRIVIVARPIDEGFILPQLSIAVISEYDITGRHRTHRSAAKDKRKTPRAIAPGASEGFFTDLAPGDYVVHYQHGVGKYVGMVRRALGGAERDYLLIEYKGNDKLYIPSDQLDLLTRYGGGETPTLHKLGGSDFQRTQARVRKEIEKVAQELIILYSKRLAASGISFSVDTPWQQELEDSFEFSETPDQLKAIKDVKADMEAPSPMDRIICGDVGFGKTEIAVRAAFKAVQDGKQVAVLVPTTLLAQQHYETFSQRMIQFPVKIEVLSRFLTTQQSRKVVASISQGDVDVIIGTHRLLSDDVKFKNLGLLVVDEEQRFGVNHKEAIKKLSTSIDVLTLTASPIPRTLEMGLTGIRDITMLSTPPLARQPILTYVGPYEESAVIEAIRRELLREGQVFYVHNRIRDIQQCANRLRELVPDARIAVAHGQMDEGRLERIVVDFADGKFDVLCCTTIIESGIDMPTVNTLVVDRADMLGLGQLHQLRGRVGRSGQRAYAYLLYPPDVSLSEQAYERLRTIGENVELGSGLKIAMRDLEIRGAGNLLGRNQSGHIAAVGYDMYVSMVSQALEELKGEVTTKPAEVKLELPVDAFIPNDYISRDDLRVEAYRNLASITSYDALSDIENEWRDRYGEIPIQARSLLGVAKLRVLCLGVGVQEIIVTPGRPGGPNGGKTVAKIMPISLKSSAQVRLRRLFPDSVYKQSIQSGADSFLAEESSNRGVLTLIVPKSNKPIAGFLFDTINELLDMGQDNPV